jgi:PAS domain-containing protein
VPPVQSEVPPLQAVQSRDYADPGCAPEERDDAAPGSPEARPALRLVDGAEPAASTMWFCGYCGEVPSDPLAPAPVARVCRSCEQGLMLEARADAAPTASEPFLVVDSRLTIQAVSKQAEEILGVREEDATNRPVAELLVGADSEAGADRSLATMLMDAASESDQPETTFVRPRATYGVRLRARIATCGPPRAALIVFERSPTQPSPLRVVREGLPIAEHG